jgi:hypothetical protein
VKRGIAIAVLLGLTLAVGATPATAATSPVTIDKQEVELAEKDGGGWTTSVGVTNLTDGNVTLAAKPAAAATGCDPEPGSARLLPARHTDVAVTIPAACKLDGKQFKFSLTAKSGKTTTLLTVVATLKSQEPKKPDWQALWSFAIALGGMLALVVFVFVSWKPRDPVRRRLNQTLPSLPDTWSFTDSWVSNVTVAGGLLAGVLGSSDVLKSVLGDDAEASLALATVGGAIAAAFIAAAGILVISFKTRADNRFTAGGVLAAAAVALAGAAGQLWVVYESARDFELGGLQDHLLPVVLVALALLVFYAYRSLLSVLVQGAPKAPTTESETARAASRMLTALKPEDEGEAGQVDELILRVEQEGLAPAGPPDAAYGAPRRSALP